MVSNSEMNSQDIHNDAIIVDMHAHPSLKLSLFNRMLTSRFRVSRSFDPFSVRTDFTRLEDGSVNFLLSSVYAPEQGIKEECKYMKALKYVMPRKWKKIFNRSPFDVTMEMLDAMENAVDKAGAKSPDPAKAKMITSVTELEAAVQHFPDGPIGIIHCLEGAHCLEGKIENLETFFERGVAYLTLAHFYANEAVNPTFPYPESVQKAGCFKGGRDLALGLTKFGEEVVEKMVELGMILDICHCTPVARRRIFDIVANRSPIIASHVGAYEINPSPYNLRDEEIKKIADSGGTTAVIFMNYWLMPHETKRGLNFISRTIEQFVKAGGIDHVSIGTDFDGFTDPPDDLKHSGELPKLTERLITDGFSVEHIGKILGANALRVLREGWKKTE